MSVLETTRPELISFAELLQRSRSTRRRAVPILDQLAESVRPGAAVVKNLREDQPGAIDLMTAELNREFILLGQLVAAAASVQGGLVMEASRGEHARVNAIIAAARIETWAKERLIQAFEHAYQRMAQLTVKTLTRSGIPTSMRDNVEKAIIEAGGKRIGLLDIAGEAKESLFSTIEHGRELGLNPLDTAKMIQEFVPRGRFTNAGSSYRSRLISRTEVLHAQRMATLECYRASPSVERVVMFDGESDEECSARNGAVVSFDEAEAEMGSAHPNCVLCFAPYA